jgi:hypothetical protein
MEPGKERLVHVGGGHDVGITQGDAQALLDAGYAFDLVSDRQLAGVAYAGGALRAAGLPYGVVVVPETRFVPAETFEKLTALARQGATVVVRKSLPADVPGLADLDARRRQLKQLTDALHFESTSDSGVRSARVGAGRVLLGEDLPRLLAFARVRREPLVDSGVQFARRADEGGAVYFIDNRGDKPFEGWLPLASRARSAALFDPLRGESGVAATRASADGGVEVYVRLNPGESVIVKTFDAEVRGPAFPYFSPAGEPRALGGAWSVRFVEGGPVLPPARADGGLGSWTKFDGDAYKSFSGTALYTTTFDRPEGEGDWLLDLGGVAESARVRLNGEELGTLITSPFSLRIPAARLRASNTLEVEVSNLMANRVIDLDRRGVRWKKFYNTNFPARRPENRGADGLFDASRWAPKDSGLLGPVTLTPLGRVRF